MKDCAHTSEGAVDGGAEENGTEESTAVVTEETVEPAQEKSLVEAETQQQ